jgi:hypothetical protein
MSREFNTPHTKAKILKPIYQHKPVLCKKLCSKQRIQQLFVGFAIKRWQREKKPERGICRKPGDGTSEMKCV